ncbi:MAG: sodium:solute symporter [Verrucomicrobiae bacterium]|nr:sodium:solute symporter [Verrucomicrobiae bacterium]
MIGDSLSGVTFISVPGAVARNQFSYLPVVFGYAVGYWVIAGVLLPLYYRLQLTSIYGYLGTRFGPHTQKTGSAFFLLSRLLGAAARLYLAASVLQAFVFDRWGVPFWLAVAVIIALILLYTFKGGIQTLVWTDLFQSGFLVLGVVLSLWAISRELGLGFGGLLDVVKQSPHSQWFFSDWASTKNFWRQLASGAAIAIVMTGMDQNSMQKNLACRSLRDAQKNLLLFSIIVVVVNLFFLALGALLYHYAAVKGIAIPAKTDLLFPTLALEHLGVFAALVFVIGLTAATFNSADSVLTTLTTSFLIDVVGVRNVGDADQTRLRHRVHVGFAVALLGVILTFRVLNKDAVIDLVLKMAGYTYGPLLGLFTFGLFTRWTVRERLAPVVCVVAPILCWLLDVNSKVWLNGYTFGFELLILNGAVTFAGLCALKVKAATGDTDCTD